MPGPSEPGAAGAALARPGASAGSDPSPIPAVAYGLRPGGDFPVAHVGPTVARLTGRAPRDLLGLPLWDGGLVHPEDADRLRRAIDAAMRDGAASAECRMRGPSGGYRRVRHELHLVPGDGAPDEGPGAAPREVAGCMVDLGPEPEAGAERAAGRAAGGGAQDLLDLAAEEAGVGAWEVDLPRGAVTLSPALRRMAGLPPGRGGDPAPGVGVEALLHPEDRPVFAEALSRHLAHRGAVRPRCRMVLPGGGLRWVDLVVQAAWDPAGRPVRLAGVAVDVTEAVLEAERLRASERRFRDFAEVASDWMWELDAGLRFTYLSDQLAASTGLVPRALIGLTRAEVAEGGTDTPEWARYHADIAARRPIQGFEYAYRRPDGERGWLRVNGKPVFGRDGAFLGYRGTGTNVTAERALRVSEARASRAELVLSDAVESLPDGFILLDAERRFVMCNRRYRELYPSLDDLLVPGTPFEALIRRFREADGHEPPEGFEAFLSARTESGLSPFVGEQRTAQGRWIRVSDRRTSDGGVVGIRTDITEAKRQQEALLRREQELSDAQRIARMGHWRLDVATGAYEWSAGTYHIMDIAPEAYRPTLEDVMSRVHEDDREEIARRLALCLEGGSTAEWEYRTRDARGRELVLRAEGRSELGPDGSVAAVFGICRDVTAEREMEASLREAKEAAEAASRAKSEFLASMSHELRTPLNAILGFSEMLKGQYLGPLGGRYREYAEDIHRSGRHLLDLIGDLLDMARIEAGRMEFNEGPVALAEVLEEALALAGLSPGERRHAVALDLPDPAPCLLADRRALKQVLINVLGNAAKFTPEGGRVAVGVRRSRRGLEIAVSDNGIGIPRHRIGELCQPFSRIEGVMARRHEGSGMGLFISRSLLERHGGDLRIESREGEGTSVHILLPAERLIA
jgi:two-component system cell cycle sensor histidine kinase PleC